MISIPFLSGELAFAGIWLLLRIAVWLQRKKIDGKRELLLLLMAVNLAVILRMTFFPMATVDGRVQPLLLDPEAVFPLRINWIPLVNLLDYDSLRDLLSNVIGNLCLFIPTGILLPILYPRLDRFAKVVGVGTLISLGIELLQLPFSVRVSDVDDLLLNTLGVAVGCGISTGIREIIKNTPVRPGEKEEKP